MVAPGLAPCLSSIRKERDATGQDRRDDTDFLVVHDHSPVRVPRHNECDGTSDRIGDMSGLINYRIAMNSIATRYLCSGWRCRFPLRLYDALAAQRLFKPFERCCRNQFAARVAWS